MYGRVLDSDLPGYVRAAALQGLSLAAPAGAAVTRVVAALKSGDKQLQMVAAKVARGIPGQQASLLLATALSDLPSDSQVLLIRAMADRGDGAAREAVTKACSSEDARVRAAALEALGTVGDVTSIPMLIKATGGNRGRANLPREPALWPCAAKALMKP